MKAVTPSGDPDDAPGPRAVNEQSVAPAETAPARDLLAAARRRVSVPLYLLVSAAALALAAIGALILAGGEASSGGKLYAGPAVVTAEPAAFWENIDANNVSTSTVSGVEGDALSVDLSGEREFFSVLEHNFSEPLSLAGRRWLFLEFRGTGDGAAYTLLLDARTDRDDSATYNFADTTDGWRVLSFDLLTPGEGDAPAESDADRILKLRLTTDKENEGSFAVGRLSTSQPAG